MGVLANVSEVKCYLWSSAICTLFIQTKCITVCLISIYQNQTGGKKKKWMKWKLLWDCVKDSWRWRRWQVALWSFSPIHHKNSVKTINYYTTTSLASCNQQEFFSSDLIRLLTYLLEDHTETPNENGWDCGQQ